MLRRIILNRLAAAERALGEPLDYMRYVARTSTAAFLRIALLSPVQWARKRLPADAYYTAMVVATRHEDCGTCVQTSLERYLDKLWIGKLLGTSQVRAPDG
jgi:hypothetical protein